MYCNNDKFLSNDSGFIVHHVTFRKYIFAQGIGNKEDTLSTVWNEMIRKNGMGVAITVTDYFFGVRSMRMNLLRRE